MIREAKNLFYQYNKDGYYPFSVLAELSSEVDEDGEEIVNTSNIMVIDENNKLYCSDSTWGSETNVPLENLSDEALKEVVFAMRHTILDKSNRPAVTRRWLEEIVNDYKLNSHLI